MTLPNSFGAEIKATDKLRPPPPRGAQSAENKGNTPEASPDPDANAPVAERQKFTSEKSL